MNKYPVSAPRDIKAEFAQFVDCAVGSITFCIIIIMLFALS